MVHPTCVMYWLYTWAEAGLDMYFGTLNQFFEAKDAFNETEARARGLLDEEDLYD